MTQLVDTSRALMVKLCVPKDEMGFPNDTETTNGRNCNFTSSLIRLQLLVNGDSTSSNTMLAAGSPALIIVPSTSVSTTSGISVP